MKSTLTASLLFSLFLNTIPLIAQSTSDSLAMQTGEPADKVSKFHSADGAIFAAEVARLAPGSDIPEALEAQSAYFIEQFLDATKGQFEKGVTKSREFKKKRREEALKKTLPARAPRVYGKSNPPDFGIDFIENLTNVDGASLSYAPDGIQTVDVETDTSVMSSATQQKSIDTPEVTVTRNQTVNSEVGYDAKNTMSKNMGTEETVETTSKTDGRKVMKTSKMSFGASLEICPDFAGIVRGTGTAKFFSQTTIITGKQLAALTTDYTVDFRVTGYVNDEAEMTHFDLKGTAIEKTIGFDRALRLGMVTSTNGLTDGTRSMFVQFDGNTPPRSVPNEYGGTKDITPVLGKGISKPLPTNTGADNRRLADATVAASGAFIIDLDLLMRSSISRWRHYECVSIKCTAPKTVVAPNESVDVTAVSISTLDQSRFNAKLNGTGTQTVTPGDQNGTPSAVYSLTAPEKEKATFVVKSVSRRGIGLEVLEIPVQEAKKKPPVKLPAPKAKNCDQGWTGTVKAVRTFRKLERGKADGRLLRELRNLDSTYSVDITLTGTRELTGGIVNNFHGNARVGYVKDEQRERNYAPGKMSCNSRIIQSPETQKNILNYKGDSSGQILVAIAINGNIGHIDFSPPPTQASFTHSYIYETACPSYDHVNTKTSRSDYMHDVTETGFEVDFPLDPSSPNALSGSKTVQESDGSETIYTWSLSRCQ